MLEESTSVEKISDLLLSSSHKSFQIAETNFRIGRLVQEVLDEHGESAVTELARTLAAKGVIASVGFLFDASRVFRTIKNEETLAEIKSKLNGKLSWGFLVNNCTRIPEGDTEEARIYWEKQLQQIESSQGKVDRIMENIEKLPEALKPQAEGLFSVLGHEAPMAEAQERRRRVRKVLHIGDEHYDDSDLLSDVEKSGRFIVEEAIKERPDLIISSGDILNVRQSHDSPALRAVIEFVKGLASVAPVFILKGTTLHDGLSVKFLESLDTVHAVYVSESAGQVGLAGGRFFPVDAYVAGLDALIYSLPPASKANIVANGGQGINDASLKVSRLIREIFTIWGNYSDLARKDGVPTIISAHGTLTGATTSTGQIMVGRDIEFSLGDILAARADVACLAHIHKARAFRS